MKLLTNPWVAAALGGVIFCVTLILGAGKHTAQAPDPTSHSDAPAALPREPKPSWEFLDPEIEHLVAELKQEKKSLAEREAQLNELATRIKSERAELSQATQTVHRLQVEFDSRLIRIKEAEVANIKRLAKTYTSISAEGAARVLREMDDPTIVQILSFMKESAGGAILDALAKASPADAKRAAAISDRIKLLEPEPEGKTASK